MNIKTQYYSSNANDLFMDIFDPADAWSTNFPGLAGWADLVNGGFSAYFYHGTAHPNYYIYLRNMNTNYYEFTTTCLYWSRETYNTEMHNLNLKYTTATASCYWITFNRNIAIVCTAKIICSSWIYNLPHPPFA